MLTLLGWLLMRLAFSPPLDRRGRTRAASAAERALAIDRLITANNRTVGIHRDRDGHVCGYPRRRVRALIGED